MYFQDIIKRKRDKKSLTEQDIEYAVNGFVKGRIPDYQMSAFLMACFINGLGKKETFHLTRSMMNSGEFYDFKDIEGIKADKHSTGGVGDKASIVLAPLLAVLGFYVPMVSGRGLGHTGGTLDKLESIKGFNVNLSKNQFKKILKNNRVVMAGQTEKFVPADKKMYSLRDAAGIVESIPLITASIMSKKLCEGIDTLLLDVKTGNGAFMKSIREAEALAENMFKTGLLFKKKMLYMITDMNQVLGDTCGNGIEILECIEILKGNLKNDVYKLIREMAEMIMKKNKMADNKNNAQKLIDRMIDDGYAYEKFEKMVSMQNGDLKCLNKRNLVCAKTISVKSKKSGYLSFMDTYNIGVALINLKAGRFKKDDEINHKTGIEVKKHIGDKVEKGDEIFGIHYKDKYDSSKIILEKCFKISNNKAKTPELIKYKKGV